MAESTAGKKTTTPRKPQDRKPKAVVVDITKTPGWDLLTPMSDIPVWDQTPLIDLVRGAMKGEQQEANGEVSFEMSAVGEIAKALLPFAVDQAEYTKFVSGPGALEKAMTLAMAWVGQMGESSSSES